MRRILAVIALTIVFLPSFAMAQTVLTPSESGLEATGSPIYGESLSLSEYIGTRILLPAFGIVGLVFMLFFTYAGFLYLTAAGNTTQVGKAKTMMQTAVIGVVLIASAYVITVAVINAISVGSITGAGGGTPAP
ncbi:MAG: hypothetical protein O3B64_02405 [bacterium]|nr:hypothetical protein [bacterium]MDA1024348.1 hypothetical protein [bacterium]